MRSTTSSVRLPNELRIRLENATQLLKTGKNSLFVQALEEFLEKVERRAFLEEARKQSIAASAASHHDEEFWTRQSDSSGWK